MRPLLRNRYRLERLLSERDATTTHLAVDEARGRKVVVKTLSLKAATEEELRLFEREAALLETLSHPRVPRYVEHWVEESEGRVALHLVQDHVDGETLERLTRGGRRFSEEEVRRVGAEIADVLAYLHALRPPVVHRDLKPSNVIVDERGGPHLIDFGAATAARSTGRTVVGTYGYMPPEQYEGRALPESDVYALGATLLFLLTHRHPWESDGGVRGALAQAAMGESTRRILSALTAVAPEERPSAEEAAALLRGEGAMRARGSSSIARPAPSMRLVLVLVAIATLGVTLAAAGALGYLFLRSAPPLPPAAQPVMPPVPAPAPGAAKASRREALASATRCLLRAAPQVFQSRARYLSWVDEKKGPTCKERYVSYGLYAPYLDAVEACSEAAAALEASGERHAPFRALAEVGGTFLPFVEETSVYYEDEDFRDDGCAKGKAAHPRLMDGYTRWEALVREASSTLDAILARGTFGEVGESPRAKALARFTDAVVAVAHAAPAFAEEPVDAARFDEALARLKRAQKALEEAEPPALANLEPAWKAIGHASKMTARELKGAVRRAKDDARKKRRATKETWDPTGIRALAFGELLTFLTLPDVLL